MAVTPRSDDSHYSSASEVSCTQSAIRSSLLVVGGIMGMVQHWQLLRVVKGRTLFVLQGGSSGTGGLCSPTSGASHRSAKLAALPASVASMCTSGNEVLAAAFAAQAMDGGEEAAPSGPGAPVADGLQGTTASAFQQGSLPAAQQADGLQQESGPAPVSGLDVCSDPRDVPVGIAGPMASGECLYHHPARPINVPDLQVSASCVMCHPASTAIAMLGCVRVYCWDSRTFAALAGGAGHDGGHAAGGRGRAVVPRSVAAQGMLHICNLIYDCILSCCIVHVQALCQTPLQYRHRSQAVKPHVSPGGGEGGAEVRARLAAPGLAADMAAFKAANPGACLADFVRWHSPRDWLPLPLPGRLSPRMAHPVRR